jgi:hypothetical protein
MTSPSAIGTQREPANMAKIPTQGSEIFFSDDGTLVSEIGCALSIAVGASAADLIDITCLADIVRTSMPGLKTLAQITISGAVEDDDPAYPLLVQLGASRAVVPWYIGLSNGTSAPTLVAGEFTPPTDRSGYTFTGYVASVSPEIAQNNIVKYNLVIQPATDLVFSPKAAGL